MSLQYVVKLEMLIAPVLCAIVTKRNCNRGLQIH